MIRITVDTKEELNIVQRVLRSEACSHRICSDPNKHCTECVSKYFENKVKLYKKEIVEIPQEIVV